MSDRSNTEATHLHTGTNYSLLVIIVSVKVKIRHVWSYIYYKIHSVSRSMYLFTLTFQRKKRSNECDLKWRFLSSLWAGEVWHSSVAAPAKMSILTLVCGSERLPPNSKLKAAQNGSYHWQLPHVPDYSDGECMSATTLYNKCQLTNPQVDNNFSTHSMPYATNSALLYNPHSWILVVFTSMP